MNTKLVGVAAFLILVIYLAILASNFFGFPQMVANNYPYNYALWATVGFLVFQWTVYFLGVVEAKSKILPLTKLSMALVVGFTAENVSLSIGDFNLFVTKNLLIVIYSVIPLSAGSLITYFSFRKLRNRNRQKEVAIQHEIKAEI